MSGLFQPITVGEQIQLRNRVVMSSLTRNRCVDDNKPGLSQVKHYSDRARDGVGLIVSEGILIDWTGCDWKHAPFMIQDDHANAWRAVTDAVHEEGGLIYFQAWHAGRCQHDEMPIMREKKGVVWAPFAIRARDGKYRDLPGCPGHTENVRAVDDPRELVDIYRRSAALARQAGFDGVELMAQGRANKRTDAYGGPIKNRCRFTLEVVDAVAEVLGGPEAICVKINPTDIMNDSVVDCDEMKQIYTFLITELVDRKVGIINLGRRGLENTRGSGDFFNQVVRPHGYPLPRDYDPILEFGGLVKFSGSPTLLMVNHDLTVEEATALVQQQKIDLASFGRPFIYNPVSNNKRLQIWAGSSEFQDVMARIKNGIPFAVNDRGNEVYYGSSESPDINYNDWPPAQTN